MGIPWNLVSVLCLIFSLCLVYSWLQKYKLRTMEEIHSFIVHLEIIMEDSLTRIVMLCFTLSNNIKIEQVQVRVGVPCVGTVSFSENSIFWINYAPRHSRLHGLLFNRTPFTWNRMKESTLVELVLKLGNMFQCKRSFNMAKGKSNRDEIFKRLLLLHRCYLKISYSKKLYAMFRKIIAG